MEELIKKQDALKQIKSIPCATLEEFACKELAEQRVKRLPFTTVEEIRAQAFAEFADKLRCRLSSYNDMVVLDNLTQQLVEES